MAAAAPAAAAVATAQQGSCCSLYGKLKGAWQAVELAR
jgi:hypothetical protein